MRNSKTDTLYYRNFNIWTQSVSTLYSLFQSWTNSENFSFLWAQTELKTEVVFLFKPYILRSNSKLSCKINNLPQRDQASWVPDTHPHTLYVTGACIVLICLPWCSSFPWDSEWKYFTLGLWLFLVFVGELDVYLCWGMCLQMQTYLLEGSTDCSRFEPCYIWNIPGNNQIIHKNHPST